MTAELLKRLIEVLGDRAVIVQPDAQAPYLVDQRGYYQGAAAAVVRPASTRQVADVVGIARELGVGIVPRAATPACAAGPPR